MGLPGAAFAAALVMAWCLPVEPRHGGRSLTSWLRHGGSQSYGLSEDAERAFARMGSNAVPHLVGKLMAEDSFPEKWLARFFNSRGWGEPPVRLAWQDQVAAARAFDVIGPAAAGAIPELVPMLEDEERAYPVARALVGIGSAALPALTNALASTNATVRRTVIRLLSRLECRAGPAIPAVIRCLRDPDARVVAGALTTLGLLVLESDSVVPALVTCLEDPRADVRSQALRSLAAYEARATGALPHVVELLADPVARVRESAVNAVCCIHPAPIPLLVARLEHTDPRVRAVAVLGLRRRACRDTNVFNALTPLLADADEGVRELAAAALHSLDRPRAARMRVPLQCQ